MVALATILLWLAFVAWSWFAFVSILAFRSLKPPPLLEAGDTEFEGSVVSIIIPARDEGERIETTVRRALAQRAVVVEVIVIDDRSSDDTRQILRALASEHPSLHVVCVDELPEGWLGKCHALWRGSQVAAGDWLLFTDADTWMEDDAVARAVLLGERTKADHVSMVPGFTPMSFLGRQCMLAFAGLLLDQAQRVNRDARNGFFGVGAFNMVRRETYDAFGGHETLRLEIVDDMKLGVLVRRTGGRTRAAIGAKLATIKFGRTAGDVVRLLEKNGFAAFEYNVFAGAGMPTLMLIMTTLAALGPLISLATGSVAGYFAGAALLIAGVPSAAMARAQGWPVLSTLFAPLANPILAFAFLRSMVITLHQGGVRWRETFYPLDLLRRHRVSRSIKPVHSLSTEANSPEATGEALQAMSAHTGK